MLQQSPMTDRLLLALSPSLKESILEEWTWLVGLEKRALLATACGDVFVEDLRAGTIDFLDISTPQFSRIAETRQAFNKLIVEPSFVEAYLHPKRVDMLRSHGLVLKEGQIYSFRTPLSLGGLLSLDNIEVTDVDVHFSIAGQIECRISKVPVGTPFAGIQIDSAPDKRSWWKFW